MVFLKSHVYPILGGSLMVEIGEIRGIKCQHLLWHTSLNQRHSIPILQGKNSTKRISWIVLENLHNTNTHHKTFCTHCLAVDYAMQLNARGRFLNEICIVQQTIQSSYKCCALLHIPLTFGFKYGGGWHIKLCIL